MPESVTDRPTTDYEHVFLLAKSERYFYDSDAIREAAAEATIERNKYGRPRNEHKHFSNGVMHSDEGMPSHFRDMEPNPAGRNKRTVWTISTKPFSQWAETSRLVPVALDDVSDGTMRKPSPDCPVHGHLDHPDDERATDGQSRNQRIDGRPVQGQPNERAGNSKNPAQQNQAYNSDSQGQQYSLFATDHNSQSRKTDRAHPTSQRDTAFAQTQSRKRHTPPSRGRGDSAERKRESSISESGSSDNQTTETARHNGRKSLHTVSFEASDKSLLDNCTCQFYHEVTEKTSHFATFPPDLVEPMVKAGTSERGCCPECGAPWERVVEKPDMSQRPTRANGSKMDTDAVHLSNNWQDYPKSAGQAYQKWRNANPDVTVGWRPTCDHDAEPVPCTVLDPFFGAGTTGLVADRLGRDAIGIELNESYAEMAARRLYQDAGMFADVEVCG